MTIFLDAAVLAVLIFCAWRGAARGFVLTLCGLLAAVVAFCGAFWISDHFAQPVSEMLQPYVQVHVETLLTDAAEQTKDAAQTAPSPGLSIPGVAPDEPEASFSLEDVLEALGDSALFSGLLQSVSDAIDEGVLTVVTTAAAAVAAFLSYQLARSGLFLLSFVVILLVWWLLSHALDLAFRLPVLRTLNKTGGLLLGLVKGALILLVACWAVRVFDLVPAQTAAQTYLFRYFMNFHVI